MTPKERYFKKVYENAPIIECECGCGTLIKAKDKYGRDKHFVNGHNGRKYDDPTQHKREYNHRHRKERYQYKKELILARKLRMIDMLGGHCQHCGLRATVDNYVVFDFHHKDPETKIFNLNSNTLNKVSKAEALEELSKCELLCANCHRLHHHRRENEKITNN